MLHRSLDRARARRSDEGFTLIELLIVIIILGILAAIVVFSVAGIQDKGRKSACNSAVETVNTALEAAYANGDGAVTTIGALVPKYLHQDANFTPSSGASVTVNSGSNAYTVTILLPSGNTVYSAYGVAGSGPATTASVCS